MIEYRTYEINKDSKNTWKQFDLYEVDKLNLQLKNENHIMQCKCKEEENIVSKLHNDLLQIALHT